MFNYQIREARPDPDDMRIQKQGKPTESVLIDSGILDKPKFNVRAKEH